ncbi:hypothetical protein D3C83_09780 [compost metagenome]
MAAVDAAPALEQPWYSRAWRTWPLGWQAAALVLLLAALGGAAAAAPAVQAALDAVPLVSSVRAEVADTARSVETTTTALRVLWRTLVAPVVPYAFGLVTLMCAACALFGTALNHLVFGKALR